MEGKEPPMEEPPMGGKKPPMERKEPPMEGKEPTMERKGPPMSSSSRVAEAARNDGAQKVSAGTWAEPAPQSPRATKPSGSAESPYVEVVGRHDDKAWAVTMHPELPYFLRKKAVVIIHDEGDAVRQQPTVGQRYPLVIGEEPRRGLVESRRPTKR